MSDGEFQEGQTWEALAAIRHHALDNMAIIVDVNAHQCDGRMSDVLEIAPLAERVRAFGAAVHDIDGHDLDAMAAAADEPRGDGRALVVLCNTDPCRGLETMRSRAPHLHYLRFKSPEERASYEAAYAEMCATDGSAIAIS
jgi:transketolase